MFGVMVKGGVRGELCKYWDIKLIFHAAGRYEYRCRAGAEGAHPGSLNLKM